MRKKRAMRELVTIQTLTTTVDAVGQRVPTFKTNSDLFRIPAHVEHIAGAETFRGHQLEAGVVAVFEMRNADVSAMDQLTHVTGKNKAYGITSVRPVEGKFEGGFKWMYVFVKAVADG